MDSYSSSLYPYDIVLDWLHPPSIRDPRNSLVVLPPSQVPAGPGPIGRRGYEAVALNPQPLPPKGLAAARVLQLLARREVINALPDGESRKALLYEIEGSLTAIQEDICGNNVVKPPPRDWWSPPPPKPHPNEMVEGLAGIAAMLPKGEIQTGLRKFAAGILQAST